MSIQVSGLKCTAFMHDITYSIDTRTQTKNQTFYIKILKYTIKFNFKQILKKHVMALFPDNLGAPVLTRSSADADNGLDAFSGQSRSTNMVPFWVHCDFSLSM